MDHITLMNKIDALFKDNAADEGKITNGICQLLDEYGQAAVFEYLKQTLRVSYLKSKALKTRLDSFQDGLVDQVEAQ